MSQGSLRAGLLVLAVLGFTALARAADAPGPTLDAGEFQKRITAWTTTHYGEENIDPGPSTEALETRAAQGDANAYSQLAERADMQEHPALAYQLSLKAIALGLTRPATLFMGLNEVDEQLPPEPTQEARWEAVREHDLAWYLVAAIRGDSDGARMADWKLKPNGMTPNPLSPAQAEKVCGLAVRDYQLVQVTRVSLGKLPFTDADNRPLTAFWGEEDPWPIPLCGELPLPEMHCAVATLTGGKAANKNPRSKPFLCTSPGLIAGAKPIPLPMAKPVTAEESPAIVAAPGPVMVMGTANGDNDMDPIESGPGDLFSGADGDPMLHYHFRVEDAAYAIGSSSQGIQGKGGTKRPFAVPASPMYVDGPVSYAGYAGDLLLLYQADLPWDDAVAKEKESETYLVRIKPDTLSMVWNNSGIPPDAAPARIVSSTAYVGAEYFLGAVDLDTGKFRWCLRGLDAVTGDAFHRVATPSWNPHQVELDSLPGKDGSRHYVKVDLDQLKVSTDFGTATSLSVSRDCPVFR